jgi:probable phosphoglycerate mutase
VSIGATMRVHLIRHGHHALLGKTLCGRGHAIPLDAEGQRDMENAARRLAQENITAIQSSPQLRARESADIIAAACKAPIEIVAGFDEHDAGDWSGRSFDELASDPCWHRWNIDRAHTSPPNGESMAMLQARVVAHLYCLAPSTGSIAIVSHAEPIRAALMHVLSVPLDRYWSVEVDPGSVSTIEIVPGRIRVARLNERAAA